MAGHARFFLCKIRNIILIEIIMRIGGDKKKRQSTDLEKIFAKYMTNKELMKTQSFQSCGHC